MMFSQERVPFPKLFIVQYIEKNRIFGLRYAFYESGMPFGT